MQKITQLLFLSCFLLSSVFVSAQTVITTEDFEGVTIPNLPAGFNSVVGPGADDWRTGTNLTASTSSLCQVFPIHTQFAWISDDSCNCTMTPITRLDMPALNLTTYSKCQLSFNSFFWDGAGPCGGGAGLEDAVVQVSTDGGFTFTTVLNVPGGTGVWDSIIVNLDAYAGLPSVIIGFNYDDLGNWGYGWGVDDILVMEPPSFAFPDAVLLDWPYDYTVVPLEQVQQLDLDVFGVTNTGTDTLKGISATGNILDPSNAVAYTMALTPAATEAAPGAFVGFTEGGAGFTPNDTGVWTLQFFVNSTNGGADTLLYQLTVDDSLYARDFGTPVNAVGFNNPNTGTMGNLFDIVTTQRLVTVEVFYNGNTNVGDQFTASVYNVVAGTPDINDLVGTSDTFTISALDTPLNFVEFFFDDTINLLPGQYYIGVEQITANNAGILVDDNISVAGGAWFSVNGGAFADLQTAGLGNILPLVRANLSDPIFFALNNVGFLDFMSEYIIVPEDQVQPLDLDVFAVQNLGSDTLNLINVTGTVFDPNNNPAYFPVYTGVLDVAPGGLNQFTDIGAGFTPNDTGTWTVQVISTASNAAPDTVELIFVVDETLYARDFGATPVIDVGLGGVPGGIGNNFDVITPAWLQSANGSFDAVGNVGDSLSASVWGTIAGVPDTSLLIATSDVYVISAADTPVNFFEFIFPDTVILLAGEYHVTIDQLTGTNMELWHDDAIVTAAAPVSQHYFYVQGGNFTSIIGALAPPFDQIVPSTRANLAPPPPSFDVDVNALLISEYTAIPIDHVTGPFTFGAQVVDQSTQDPSSVTVDVVVRDEANAVVFTTTLPIVATLPVGTDTVLIEASPSWIPSDTGLYTIDYIVSILQMDVDPTNDTSSTFIRITDDYYARDATVLSNDLDYNNNVAAGLITTSVGWNGATTEGNYGNLQDVAITSRIERVGAFINGTDLGVAMLEIGDTISARLYDVGPDGVTPDENAFLFESALKIVTAADTGQRYLEFDFTGDTILAYPGGNFFVGIHEFTTSDMFVGVSPLNVFNQRHWMNVEGTAFNDLVVDFAFNNVWTVRTFVGEPPVLEADADVDAGFPSEYTVIPKSQVHPLNIFCGVDNLGTDTITNVTVTGEVFDPTNALVYTATFTPEPLILSGNTVIFNDGGAGYTPDTNTLGTYTVRYIVTINETDIDPSNDTSEVQFILNDTLYSRDYFTLTGDNGFRNPGFGVNGVGTISHLGNTFELLNGASIEGAQFASDGLNIGDTVRVDIFAVNAGVPDLNTVVGQTEEHVVTAADTVNGVYTIPIDGLTNLAPGDYMFGVREYSSVNNMGVQPGNFIYTANTTFGNVSGGGFFEITLITAPALTEPFIVNAILGQTVACPAFVVNDAIIGDTCSGGTGEVALTVSGGNGGYTYAWTGGGGSAATASSLAGGNYTVTITDQNSCDTILTYTVPDVTQGATITANVTDANCGSANGAVDITVSGFPGTYTYSWSNSATTQDINSVTAGNYTVVVTGPYAGCVDSNTFSVSEIGGPSVDTLVVTDVTCNGDMDGAITSTVTGGTGTLTYAWSNSSSAQNLTGLNGGLYQLTVTDMAGCQGFGAANVDEPAVLSISMNVDANVQCFGNNIGQITATVTGGTPNYTYSWSGGAGSTATVSNLAPNTYNLTVTDANSCTATNSATVAGPTAALSVSIGTAINVSCPGGNDGQLSANATGGTPNYTYNWSNGGTGFVQTGLTAGTYTVTVTDNNGCTATATQSVSQPGAINVNATLVQPTCNGDSDGSITVAASGGNGGPFTYTLLATGANGPSFTGLAAGNHTVRIEDASGCQLDTTFALGEPTVFSITNAATTNDTCLSGIGTVSYNIAGSNGSYSYMWSNSATSQNLSNVVGNTTYTVTITDGSGCDTVASWTVNNVNNPISTSANITQSTCGAAGGAVDLSIATGFGFVTYSYVWSNGPTTQDISGLVAGTYTVTVTDNTYGCMDTASYNVNDLGAPTIDTLVVVDNQCFGDAFGSVTSTVSGGTGAITYSWSNSATTPNLSNLTAGTYILTVTDGIGCKASRVAVVDEPSQLVATAVVDRNVDCNGNATGQATVTVTGGVPGYNYNWGTATTATAPNLVAGPYTVTVTDANSCTATSSVTVTQPTAVTATFLTTDVSCNGGNDGASVSNVTGGVSPYTYAWSTTPTQTTFNASNLTAGIYMLTVTDDSNCVNVFNDTITEPDPLVISFTDLQNVLCYGQSNGSITAPVTGGTQPYNFLWNTAPIQNDSIANNIQAGTYSLTVTDNNGCVAVDSTTIFQPDSLSLTIDSLILPSGASATDGEILLTVTGGTIIGDYTFNWSNGSTTLDLDNLAPGTYSLTVTDDNGCTITFSDSLGIFIGIGDVVAGLEDFAIYPNPTTGNVNVELLLNSQAEVQLEVFNIIGERVYATKGENIREMKRTIDLSNFADGVYLAKVTIGDKAITKRIILNK